MKNKRFTAKILIDIGMTICLLLLMPYSLLSETAHEWIGMAMLVLFISHYILNHKWVTSVRKGKYNAFRVIQTVLVIIMLILIMGSMISGILLSNHIFKWIKISGTYMTARQIHTYVLRILGTGGDVITSRISLEYSGSNGRTIMGTSIRHQNMGSKICRNHNCRLWFICILQETDRRLSDYEDAFCIL